MLAVWRGSGVRILLLRPQPELTQHPTHCQVEPTLEDEVDPCVCPEAKCLEEDTLIVLAYAAFCVALGLVVALLVIWADKARGSKTRAKVADNVEVIGNIHLRAVSTSSCPE